MLSCFSCVWIFATPWTVVWQDTLSMGFSRQEYGSGFAVSYSIKAINLSNISYNGKPWERLVKCVKFFFPVPMHRRTGSWKKRLFCLIFRQRGKVSWERPSCQNTILLVNKIREAKSEVKEIDSTCSHNWLFPGTIIPIFIPYTRYIWVWGLF